MPTDRGRASLLYRICNSPRMVSKRNESRHVREHAGFHFYTKYAKTVFTCLSKLSCNPSPNLK